MDHLKIQNIIHDISLINVLMKLLLYFFIIFLICSCELCNGCNSSHELSIENCYGSQVNVVMIPTEKFSFDKFLKSRKSIDTITISLKYPERRSIGFVHYQDLKNGYAFEKIFTVRNSDTTHIKFPADFEGMMDRDVIGEVAIPLSICL